MSSPAVVRKVLGDSLGEEVLLLNNSYRNILLDLLRYEEAFQLCELLGIRVASDPFKTLKATTFHRGSEREQLLFRFFEKTPPILEDLDQPNSNTQITPSRCLFRHQRNAAREVSTLLREPPYRVLLHMPTGSGKTRTAINLVCEYLRENEPALVVWLASTEELCEQAASEFSSNWSILGNRIVGIHRFWSKHEVSPDDCQDGLLIVGLPKLVKRSNDLDFINSLSGQCRFVIVDEAHQAVAPYYKIVIQSLLVQNRRTALLGLTATPGRTWDNIAADQELSSFFGRRKVTLEIPGFENPVDYLVSAGYLAKATFISLLCESGYTISDNDRAKIRDSLDIPESILENLAVDEIRNLTILSRIEQLIQRHRRIIVFATSVNHAHLLAAVLSAKGHSASAITTKTPPSERSKLIKQYKEEPIETSCVLLNYGVLTTGFDAPRTSCVVIARPTKSLILYSQMVGRALRGPKAGGNKCAEIVTVLDRQLPGFGNISEAFSNWEDVWH